VRDELKLRRIVKQRTKRTESISQQRKMAKNKNIIRLLFGNLFKFTRAAVARQSGPIRVRHTTTNETHGTGAPNTLNAHRTYGGNLEQV